MSWFLELFAPFYAIIILYDPMIEQASILSILNLSRHQNHVNVHSSEI